MNRAPVVVEMRLVRLNGELLDARLLIPDEAAALGLKAFAWADRRADKDAVDLWRCLEVARAARLGPDDLATGRLVEVGAILRHAFDRPDGAALRALLRYRKLVGPAAAQIGTRIAALLDSVCGTS